MARVLRTSLVAPSPAGAALHERSLPLTYLDALWLHATPVERVFFYPDATSDVLSNLTDSLSNALAAFYPLAGRLRLTPGAHNRYELHYQPGDGVTFTVAEYHHLGFGELATDDPTEVAKIVPVLRGGLAIGVTVHHAACDGVSSSYFLRTWAWAAAACSGASAPQPPLVDRSIIRPRDDLYDAFTAPRLSSNDDDDGGKPPDLPVVQQLLATFTLSKEHLQSIKEAVAGEAERRGVPPPRATSIIAAFGFIWQCYVRAKPSTDGRATSSYPRTTGRGWSRPSPTSTSGTASVRASRQCPGGMSLPPARTVCSPRARRSPRPSTEWCAAGLPTETGGWSASSRRTARAACR
ncbi:unnamed protein product [Triticum turgidum subsp. durum]|uniref:Uncharacterized protein n=1 Tax=Triticum turgidum subsp. durum TaxID=4567 RepID=A0A9R1P3Y2_TRITD|nr:unnamed protein product [Triticum turgidum subsp. durum]